MSSFWAGVANLLLGVEVSVIRARSAGFCLIVPIVRQIAGHTLFPIEIWDFGPTHATQRALIELLTLKDALPIDDAFKGSAIKNLSFRAVGASTQLSFKVLTSRAVNRFKN